MATTTPSPEMPTPPPRGAGDGYSYPDHPSVDAMNLYGKVNGVNGAHAEGVNGHPLPSPESAQPAAGDTTDETTNTYTYADSLKDPVAMYNKRRAEAAGNRAQEDDPAPAHSPNTARRTPQSRPYHFLSDDDQKRFEQIIEYTDAGNVVPANLLEGLDLPRGAHQRMLAAGAEARRRLELHERSVARANDRERIVTHNQQIAEQRAEEERQAEQARKDAYKQHIGAGLPEPVRPAYAGTVGSSYDTDPTKGDMSYAEWLRQGGGNGARVRQMGSLATSNIVLNDGFDVPDWVNATNPDAAPDPGASADSTDRPAPWKPAPRDGEPGPSPDTAPTTEAGSGGRPSAILRTLLNAGTSAAVIARHPNFHLPDWLRRSDEPAPTKDDDNILIEEEGESAHRVGRVRRALRKGLLLGNVTFLSEDTPDTPPAATSADSTPTTPVRTVSHGRVRVKRPVDPATNAVPRVDTSPNIIRRKAAPPPADPGTPLPHNNPAPIPELSAPTGSDTEPVPAHANPEPTLRRGAPRPTSRYVGPVNVIRAPGKKQ